MNDERADLDTPLIHIDASGFSYEKWRGAFHAMRFGILDGNSPYYRLVQPAPQAFTSPAILSNLSSQTFSRELFP